MNPIGAARTAPITFALALALASAGAAAGGPTCALRRWAGPPAPDRYGLFTIDEAGAARPLDEVADGVESVVILIHGLDDPGHLWGDTGPALAAAGHVPLRFEYANDQSIEESANDLLEALRSLADRGVERADLVTHSMGGLVARDAITRPLPEATGIAVERLVMVAPPNGGAPIARLRGLGEAREQVTRLISGEATLLGGLRDGAGEAGQDLLPGSPFLVELASRPLPASTAITIIAGRAVRSTWRPCIDRVAGERVGAYLHRAAEAIGDGLVTVRSTRLDGVDDHVIVDGDHLGLVFDWLPGDRVPPALPIILDRLAPP